MLEVLGLLVVTHQPALGLLAVLLCHLDGALGDILEEMLRQIPCNDGGGEYVKVGAGSDHIPVVVAAQLGDVVAVEGGMDAAGDLQRGIVLLQCLGGVGQGLQRLSPAELLDVVVHEAGHFIAVVFLELLHALGAAAGPVVAGAAGDGGVGLGCQR